MRNAAVGIAALCAVFAGAIQIWAQDEGPSPAGNTGQVIVASGVPEWPAAEAARFDPIPQSGNTLGDADARVLMVVFEDLQCTVCRQFSMNAEHQVIDRLVATGKVRAQLYPLTFVGQQSVTAGSWAYAASRQGLMWEFTDAFFRNSGAENSGYATEGFLRQLAAAVPGLDPALQEADAASPEAQDFLEQSKALAERLKVNGTPSVYVGTSLSNLQPVAVASVTDYAAIADAVDAVSLGHPVSTGGQGASQCSPQVKVCSATDR